MKDMKDMKEIEVVDPVKCNGSCEVCSCSIEMILFKAFFCAYYPNSFTAFVEGTSNFNAKNLQRFSKKYCTKKFNIQDASITVSAPKWLLKKMGILDVIQKIN